MENIILIGDFVKLTRSTLKTVLYYHKIGLLKEPKRSANGYRIYGAEELDQMRMIKHLKYLGLDLKQIKEILGQQENNQSMKAVLESLHSELKNEKKKIDEQITKIEELLNNGIEDLDNASFESVTFKMITETLEPKQVEHYKESCPGLINHQQNVFGVIDDFQWETDAKDNFSKIAEYFKLHPEKYKIAIEFGKRLERLKEMSEDDPEVELLAKEGADFIIKEPVLNELLYGKQGLGMTNENLFNEMSNKFLSPAQRKHKKLIQKYLDYRP